MAFSTGEIVATPEGPMPFKIVFATAGRVTAEWPVESQSEGERQIVAVLRQLRRIAEEEGYV